MKTTMNNGKTCALCLMLLWWSMLVPELLINDSTVEVVYEPGTIQESVEVLECKTGKRITQLLLEAEDDRVIYRSRLFEQCKEYINEVMNNNDT